MLVTLLLPIQYLNDKMKYFIYFKKEIAYPGCHVHVEDEKLIVFQSFFCSNIQYVKKVESVGFWEWLKDINKTQSDITGNSCSLTYVGEEDILLEDIFWDIATKVIVSKKELIYAIEQWVAFCNDRQERYIEFETLNAVI